MTPTRDDGLAGESAADSSETGPQPPRGKHFSEAKLTILAISGGLFLQFFDATAVATALPALGVALDTDPGNLHWVLTVPIIVQGLLLPGVGWSADRFGQRRLYITALALFVAASLACGFSQTMTQLVAARAVLGVSAAMLLPVSRIIVVSVTPRHEFLKAMVWLSIPATVGPVLGPVVAGAVLSVLDWRWIFFLPIPIGLLSLIAVRLLVPEVRRKHPGQFDKLGFVISASLISVVMLMVSEIVSSLLVRILLMAVTAVLAVGLAAHIRKRGNDRAIFDLGLLKLQAFRINLTAGSIARISIGGGPYLLTLLLQLAMGWNSMQTGLVLGGQALGVLLSRFCVPVAVRLLSYRTAMVVSLVLYALLGACPIFFATDTPFVWVLVVLLLGGFARASHFTLLAAISFSSVPEEKFSHASTLVSVCQQVVTGFGISIAAVLLDWTRGTGGWDTADFVLPILAISFVSLLALPGYLRLPRNLGEELVHGRPESA